MLPATATEPGVQPPLLQLRAMNDEAAAGVHAVPGGEGGAGGDTSQAFKLAYARVVLQLRDVSGRGRWWLGLCCAVLCAAAPNTVSPRRPRCPPPCLGWADGTFDARWWRAMPGAVERVGPAPPGCPAVVLTEPQL